MPARHWLRIERGLQRQFRRKRGAGREPKYAFLPTPVVAFRQQVGKRDACKLMVLEKTWPEALGAISPESLEAEGFSDFATFKADWMGATRDYFTPMLEVLVFRVRPWEPDDAETFGQRAIEHLYGEFM